MWPQGNHCWIYSHCHGVSVTNLGINLSYNTDGCSRIMPQWALGNELSYQLVTVLKCFWLTHGDWLVFNEFPGGSLVKNLPTMLETWVLSLDWEDPLEKAMATHSSILAWRIPWLYSAWDHRVRQDWTTLTLMRLFSHYMENDRASKYLSSNLGFRLNCSTSVSLRGIFQGSGLTSLDT